MESLEFVGSFLELNTASVSFGTRRSHRFSVCSVSVYRATGSVTCAGVSNRWAVHTGMETGKSEIQLNPHMGTDK